MQPTQQIQYVVNFCPENDDYQKASIVVVTEREKFEVPIICHGARGPTKSISHTFLLIELILYTMI
jgi:hypothetical protein